MVQGGCIKATAPSWGELSGCPIAGQEPKPSSLGRVCHNHSLCCLFRCKYREWLVCQDARAIGIIAFLVVLAPRRGEEVKKTVCIFVPIRHGSVPTFKFSWALLFPRKHSVTLPVTLVSTEIFAYSDTVGTRANCHCKQIFALSDTFWESGI